ncbi:MAG TPA: phosphotransferase, partial [Ktedonobacterales bacterium]|nr:phosphotransferase [Ktedonobacterales bacterium]
PSGEYVLRVYRGHADVGRVRNEQALLAQLQAAELPFAVPAPLPTRTGATIAHVHDSDSDALATLSRFIPGAPSDPHDIERVFTSGQALATLDTTLAHLTISSGEGISITPQMSDFAAWLDNAEDPFATFASLPIATEEKARLTKFYEGVQKETPRLYATLPQQAIHNDFDSTHILFADGEVTGILDFEFCTYDLRAMDLIVPLYWWPSQELGSGAEWSLIDALGSGYTSRLPLTTAELEALPSLYRLRSITTLLHRIWRYQQGLTSTRQIAGRVEMVLRHEDWLSANQEELVRRALSWQSSTQL